MPDYNWNCQVCNTEVDRGLDACPACKAPASMSMEEIEARRVRWQAERKNPSRKPFECVKCGCKEYEYGQLRASAGGVSAVFEVDNKRFIHITCQQCGYTEFYKKNLSVAESFFDFMVG